LKRTRSPLNDAAFPANTEKGDALLGLLETRLRVSVVSPRGALMPLNPGTPSCPMIGTWNGNLGKGIWAMRTTGFAKYKLREYRI
jgi:hypothetical protein